MPKNVFQINDFSGGLNNASSHRNIEDNQFVRLEGFSIGSKGILKTAGRGRLATQDVQEPYPTAYAANQSAGNNTFAFSTDRHYNGRQLDGNYISGEQWLAHADHQGTNKVHIFGRYNGGYTVISNITAAADAVITCGTHSLTTNSYVRFTDIVGNMGTDLLNNTIHKVKSTADSTHFTIEEDTQGKTYSSAGVAKGGQPGYVHATDKPQPVDGGNVQGQVEYTMVDGALRMSDANFGYTDETSKWWGYIERTLFKNTSTTDAVVAEWYAEEAECGKPAASTFKLAEGIGSTGGATYSYDPAMTGGTSSTDYFVVDEDTMDGTLTSNPTIKQINVTVEVTDESGTGVFTGVQVQVGITDDGSSGGSATFDGSNYETWTLSDRGSKTYNLTWWGAWEIPESTGDDGILSKLTVPATVDSGIIVDVTQIQLLTQTGTWANHADLGGNNIHVGFNEDTVTGSYGWGSDWEVGVSLLYDYPRRQESLVTLCTNETMGGDSFVTLTEGKAPNIPIFIKYDNDSGTSSLNWRKRVTGCKMYMRELKTPASSDRSEWYPQLECDFIDGTVKALESGHTKTAIYDSTNSQYIFSMENGFLIRPHRRSSYEIDSGVPDDEIATMVRYKTAVVANRRLYVGNILYPVSGGGIEALGDTMIKSVVNSFDILPLSNKIDVAIRDGDDIVKLMEYADRILQFKRQTLYIVNIAQDNEFLEATYSNKGIHAKSSATKTDYGIAWVNKHGCFLYNGRSIVDLTVDRKGQKVIDPEGWKGFISTNMQYPASVGYSPKEKLLIVVGNAGELTYRHTYVYDFKMGAWSFSPYGASGTSSRMISNFVNRWDGELMYTSHGTSYIYQTDIFETNSDQDTELTFTTKDYTLGPVNKKKKVYNLWVTYKATATQTSATSLMSYAIDGSGNFTNFDTVHVAGASVSTLSETIEPLLANAVAIELDEAIADTTVVDIILDANGTKELAIGDYIKVESEIMKIVLFEGTANVRVERGSMGTTSATHADNTVVYVLRWKQARFAITAPVKCYSIQFKFHPTVASALMFSDFLVEYRPLFKETT